MAENEKPPKISKCNESLRWLEDAPLFLDTDLVATLFDFIVQPEWLEAEKTKSSENTSGTESNITGGGKLELGLPSFLSWATSMSGALNINYGRRDHTEVATLNAVVAHAWDKSDRRLLCLVKTYFDKHKDQLVYMESDSGEIRRIGGATVDPGELLRSFPRPLVFLDVPQSTPIVPTMVELEEGGFRPILSQIDDAIFRDVNPCPKYSDDQTKRKEYWKQVRCHFKSREAMELLERSCDVDRIGWIDFRLPFAGDQESAHLHLQPRGRCHTGVFAYHFIHRSFKYGCRIVGTLKAGLGLNVLAVYDK